MDRNFFVAELPRYIEIELTNKCNKHCSMCQRKMLEIYNERDLQIPVLQQVLKEIDFDCQINLGGLGESLLVSNLYTMLKIIKKHSSGIKTGINTNGSFLTYDKYEWITSGCLDYLEISLNAPTSDLYFELVGDNEYDQIVNNTIGLLNYKHEKKRSYPHITVHSFNIPKFYQANKRFLSFWKNKADYVQIRELSNWGGLIDLESFGCQKGNKKLCLRPFETITIDMDGNYRLCCSDFLIKNKSNSNYSIWNISIKDYWMSKKMQELRNCWLMSKVPNNDLCVKCYPNTPNSILIR